MGLRLRVKFATLSELLSRGGLSRVIRLRDSIVESHGNLAESLLESTSFIPVQ